MSIFQTIFVFPLVCQFACLLIANLLPHPAATCSASFLALSGCLPTFYQKTGLTSHGTDEWIRSQIPFPDFNQLSQALLGLVDSGAGGNFIDHDLAFHAGTPLKSLGKTFPGEVPCGNHRETIWFLIISSERVLRWSSYCHTSSCFVTYRGRHFSSCCLLLSLQIWITI